MKTFTVFLNTCLYAIIRIDNSNKQRYIICDDILSLHMHEAVLQAIGYQKKY